MSIKNCLNCLQDFVFAIKIMWANCNVVNAEIYSPGMLKNIMTIKVNINLLSIKTGYT
jgi:hypothetical protein